MAALISTDILQKSRVFHSAEKWLLMPNYCAVENIDMEAVLLLSFRHRMFPIVERCFWTETKTKAKLAVWA